MTTDSARGPETPLTHGEKTVPAGTQLRDANRQARLDIEAAIAANYARAKELVKAGRHSTAEQREWEDCYDTIDDLLEQLAALPEEVPVDEDVIQTVDSLDDLNALYAHDNAPFPRLGEEAVARAFALTAQTETINEVLISANEDATIGQAVGQMPSHKQDTFKDPSLLRGPVIFEVEKDGVKTLVHKRFGVSLRRKIES